MPGENGGRHMFNAGENLLEPIFEFGETFVGSTRKAAADVGVTGTASYIGPVVAIVGTVVVAGVVLTFIAPRGSAPVFAQRSRSMFSA